MIIFLIEIYLENGEKQSRREEKVKNFESGQRKKLRASGNSRLRASSFGEASGIRVWRIRGS